VYCDVWQIHNLVREPQLWASYDLLSLHAPGQAETCRLVFCGMLQCTVSEQLLHFCLILMLEVQSRIAIPAQQSLFKRPSHWDLCVHLLAVWSSTRCCYVLTKHTVYE
jgi:hypothetical protein